MPYIVKSSLGIEPTILPWNEIEREKLVKEKQGYLEKNKAIEEEKPIIPEEKLEKTEEEEPEDKTETVVVKTEEEETETIKKRKKAGDK